MQNEPFQPGYQAPQQLTPNQLVLQRIINAIQARNGNRPIICTVCANNQWTVHSGFVILSISEIPIQLNLGGQTFPMVAVICTRCGNTLLLNLKILGFSDADLQSMRIDPNG